jgi:hypothetical protein
MANIEKPVPVIVDLGKQKKKHIKALKRGEGKLVPLVQGAVEGTVNSPVIVLVREKDDAVSLPGARQLLRPWRPMFRAAGLDKLFR